MINEILILINIGKFYIDYRKGFDRSALRGMRYLQLYFKIKNI